MGLLRGPLPLLCLLLGAATLWTDAALALHAWPRPHNGHHAAVRGRLGAAPGLPLCACCQPSIGAPPMISAAMLIMVTMEMTVIMTWVCPKWMLLAHRPQEAGFNGSNSQSGGEYSTKGA